MKNWTPVVQSGKAAGVMPDRVIQRNANKANKPGRKGGKARARITRAAKRRGIVISWI